MKTICTYVAFLFVLCTKATAQTTVSKTILADGLLREYRIYTPAIYDGSKKVPVVFNFHGYTSNNVMQELYADFKPIADTANFLIVLPQSTVIAGNTMWNNFGTVGSAPNDVAFINTLLDTLNADYQIDLNRIYAAGMSNGGFMSYDLACFLSHRIAAIASVTGSMVASHWQACNATHPTPIMHIHGTADAVVTYDGIGGLVSSIHIDSLVKKWAIKNNCSLSPIYHSFPDIVTTDNSTAEQYIYSNGDYGAEVELLKIINGGHTWPGAIAIPSNGNTNKDINACKEIWRFFSKYTLSQLATSSTYHNETKKFAIYPNPAREKISIYAEKDCTISIVDMTGKICRKYLLDSSRCNLDISTIHTGIYQIILTLPDGLNVYEKLIIH